MGGDLRAGGDAGDSQREKKAHKKKVYGISDERPAMEEERLSKGSRKGTGREKKKDTPDLGIIVERGQETEKRER